MNGVVRTIYTKITRLQIGIQRKNTGRHFHDTQKTIIRLCTVIFLILKDVLITLLQDNFF